MPIVVKAMAKEEYQAWLADAKQEFAILDVPQSIQLAGVN
jgi:heme/copper-type cytochrome/quinol oxidase subunit 2